MILAHWDERDISNISLVINNKDDAVQYVQDCKTWSRYINTNDKKSKWHHNNTEKLSYSNKPLFLKWRYLNDKSPFKSCEYYQPQSSSTSSSESEVRIISPLSSSPKPVPALFLVLVFSVVDQEKLVAIMQLLLDISQNLGLIAMLTNPAPLVHLAQPQARPSQSHNKPKASSSNNVSRDCRCHND